MNSISVKCFSLFSFVKKYVIILQDMYRQRPIQKIIRKHQKVSTYLKKYYIDPYVNGNAKKWQATPLKPELVGQKIIWQFWGQGINEKTPWIVKTCMKSVEENKGEYKVIILTNETIKNYIELPQFIYDKLKNDKNFKFAYFSDILRLFLLSAYGGVWIDATICMTDKIEQKLTDMDFFAFQRAEKPTNFKILEDFDIGYFSWRENFKVKILNSFIISKPNHKIVNTLKDILVNYWVNEKTAKHYFIFQIIFDDLMKLQEYKNCKKISDVEPHMMQIKIHEPYSVELWNKLKNSCFIHKLTYFKKLKPNSILSYILKDEDYYRYNIPPKQDYKNITFCSMLFNMQNNNLNKIKNMNRKFQDFYLASLKKVAANYKQLVIWCDKETDLFLKQENLKNVKTKVITFDELPRYKYRDKYIKYLKQMKKTSYNQGCLLTGLDPEEVVDYLILVLSKLDVIKYAKDKNYFCSDYFYWIDAGTYNSIYNKFWNKWDGIIETNTNRFKCCFMTDHKYITRSQINLSSYEDIALIKAPFEIPASMFLIHKNIVDLFYQKYNEAIKFLDNKELITTEQSIFSTMLKMGNYGLFEFSKIKDYTEVMNKVSKTLTDNIKNDYFNLYFKHFLYLIAHLVMNKKQLNNFKQNYLYKNSILKTLVNNFLKFILYIDKKQKIVKICGIYCLNGGKNDT